MRRQFVGLMLVLAACHRDEPMADGKPLSHWKKEATKVSFLAFWNSSKDERRHEAFRRLSEIGEPAVPALVDLLRKDAVPVSGDAFNVLANLGPRAASAVPDMIELLASKSPQLRLRAAWILGTIGPTAEPAVDRLTMLLQDQDARVRHTAAQALGQIGGSASEALARARESESPSLREASMHGIAARPLDASERQTYVATGLSDPSPEVRLRAVDLLTTVGGREAEALAKYLVRALNDSDGRVKQAAHTVFNIYLQHGGATPALLAEVLKGGDVEARADAAWHLGNASTRPFGPAYEANDAPVIAALTEALADPDAKVRLYAARALAQGDGHAREEGLRALRSELPNAEPILAVRGARTLWIASRNAAEVTPFYEAGLKDPEKWSRVETISAILDMGADAEAFRSHFERLQADPDPEVRDRAAKALHWLQARR